MAFCARLSLEAETIFMALVICLVDFTEAILVRTSFKLAINYMLRLFFVFMCYIRGRFFQDVDGAVCQLSFGQFF